jgi:hypothetical protein
LRCSAFTSSILTDSFTSLSFAHRIHLSCSHSYRPTQACLLFIHLRARHVFFAWAFFWWNQTMQFSSHYDCMTMTVWLWLYDYDCMTMTVWLWLYDYDCMTLTVWLWLYDYDCMTTTVWLRLYDYDCMTMTVWLWLYEDCISVWQWLKWLKIKSRLINNNNNKKWKSDI